MYFTRIRLRLRQKSLSSHQFTDSVTNLRIINKEKVIRQQPAADMVGAASCWYMLVFAEIEEWLKSPKSQRGDKNTSRRYACLDA